MLTDTILEDDRWQAVDLAALAETASRAALDHLGLDPDAWDIVLLGCDDARIAALNADFRDRPAPTNVLSWPALDIAPPTPGARPDLPLPCTGPDGDNTLGDIAIAFDTCQREAAASGKSLPDHVTHLVVHGVLHLMGYDHIRDPDATLMERTEVAILGKLGVGDPY